VRLGLVGYGVGGRNFHAPFVQVADGLELGGVVTRDPRRRAELGQDYPDVPVYDSQRALLDAGVDIVTITTPPRTRRELVLEAIAAGVHVVADKPFAPNAPAAPGTGRGGAVGRRRPDGISQPPVGRRHPHPACDTRTAGRPTADRVQVRPGPARAARDRAARRAAARSGQSPGRPDAVAARAGRPRARRARLDRLPRWPDRLGLRYHAHPPVRSPVAGLLDQAQPAR